MSGRRVGEVLLDGSCEAARDRVLADATAGDRALRRVGYEQRLDQRTRHLARCRKVPGFWGTEQDQVPVSAVRRAQQAAVADVGVNAVVGDVPAMRAQRGEHGALYQRRELPAG